MSTFTEIAIAGLCALVSGLYTTKFVIDIADHNTELTGGIYFALCMLAGKFGRDWLRNPPAALKFIDVLDRMLRPEPVGWCIFFASPFFGGGVAYLVYNFMI